MEHVLRSANDLEGVISLLHDRWLDVEKVELVAGTFRVPVTAEGTRRAQEADFVEILQVHPVRGLRVEDTERIGYYDIERLELSPDHSLLRILCNIPVLLELELTELPVVLKVRDRSLLP